MSKPKVKTFKLAKHLIGVTVPTYKDGHAGRYVEDLIESMGVKINRGEGCDILDYGLEVKTRDLDATSAQTVCKMHPNDIKSTAYKDSKVFKKFQQQLRVKTKENKIVSAEVYDFSPLQIQELIEEAYGIAQEKMLNGSYDDYISGTHWGYFERTTKDRPEYDFRIAAGAMEELEAMAKSTFNNIFDYK